MTVFFPYYQQKIDLPVGSTVADACRAIDYPLPTACGGSGLCGKCLVMIRTNGMTAQVMACQQPVSEGMAILISPGEQGQNQEKETRPAASFLLDPVIRCFPVLTESLLQEAADSHQTVFDILQQWLPVKLIPPSERVQAQLNPLSMNEKPLTNIFTMFDPLHSAFQIYHMHQDDKPADSLAIAVVSDATQLTAALIEIEEGEMIDIKSIEKTKNDIESSDHTHRSLAQLIRRLCCANHVPLNAIIAITCCNTKRNDLAVVRQHLPIDNHIPILSGCLLNRHSTCFGQRIIEAANHFQSQIK